MNVYNNSMYDVLIVSVMFGTVKSIIAEDKVKSKTHNTIVSRIGKSNTLFM